MNLHMGSQTFLNVQIPVLWGKRAILQSEKGLISIVDLSDKRARIEVLEDEPAPGVSFRPRLEGFVILKDGRELYSYNPSEKIISGIGLDLPELEISGDSTRVGTSRFSGNIIVGSGVGLVVRPDGVSLGAPVPQELARLRV